MIEVTSTGSFKKTEDFLSKMSKREIYNSLSKYGEEGVRALRAATPIESGETADSWSYSIVSDRRYNGIIWSNSHSVDGRPVAILLQYGHATGTGGYVQGRDYINPVIKSLFDRIAADVWKVVMAS